jgi:uncharacterized membrane protein
LDDRADPRFGRLTLGTTATIFMAGVLWTMHLLNYPLLALVGTEAFPLYEAVHNRRFALVVVPGVLAAAAGGIGLVASRPGQVPLWAPAGELALLLVVIISTAALQGRQHRALGAGFDQRTHSLLIRSNWIRVAAWPAAAAIALWMGHQAFMP